ncbi:ATP-binding protein [Actinocorallia sp. API 0066]|uniref:ATP-binding protein n=1 Tax=Actinocorallia sp. API 0066 TaxID=2896846 RepID=UPI001E5AC77B|nr:ATP-binding protein [Actinocorallia sp. API 0066]MCD0449457.1 ATP-binding protein [Actinocorallia sp. API 0066]
MTPSTATDSVTSVEKSFAAVSASSAAVRRWVKDEVRAKVGHESGHPAAETAELVVSEYFSNAVRHGVEGGTAEIRLTFTDVSVLVEVSNETATGGDPAPADIDELAENGRGLGIVEAVAWDSGWERGEDGKRRAWALLGFGEDPGAA